MCFCGHSSAQWFDVGTRHIFAEQIGKALGLAIDATINTTEHSKALNDGVRCYKEGFYDNAIKHLLLVDETDRDYARVIAWSTLADCYYKKYYYTKALGYIDKVKSFEKSFNTVYRETIDLEKEHVCQLELLIEPSAL